MKITEIRTFLVGRFLLVRVYTDEGIVGNGEAGLWAHHGVVKEALGELSDYYVGKDPLCIEHHYQVVSRSAHFMGAAMSAAMSAIDIALWDIFGKAVGFARVSVVGRQVPRQGKGVRERRGADARGSAGECAGADGAGVYVVSDDAVCQRV